MSDRRTTLFVVCVAVFVDMVGFGIILPVLPFHAQRLGGSGAWVGALLTAYAIAQFISAPILGTLSDRLGRRRILLLSLAGSAVAMTLTGLAGSLILLLAARFVAGSFGGAIAVGQAYAADLYPDGAGRTRALGMVGAAIGLGFVFGPAIGAAVASYGFAATAFVAAGLAAVNLIVGMLTLPAHHSAQPAHAPRRATVASLGHAARERRLRPALYAAFSSTLAFTGMEATFALLGADRFAMGPADLGVVFTGVGVVMVVVQGALVGRLARRYDEASIAVVAAGLLTVSLVVLPFGPLWLTYATLGVLAVGQGLFSPANAALVARAADSETGAAFGISSSAAAAARAIGPLIAGALYDVHRTIPYLFGGALCATCAAVLAAAATLPAPTKGAQRESRRAAVVNPAVNSGRRTQRPTE